MKASLVIFYENGDFETVILDHVVEIDVPKPSVEFAPNGKGKWTMRITTGLTLGKKLVENFPFLEARKLLDYSHENQQRIASERTWDEYVKSIQSTEPSSPPTP